MKIFRKRYIVGEEFKQCAIIKFKMNLAMSEKGMLQFFEN